MDLVSIEIVSLVSCPPGFRAVFATAFGPAFKPISSIALVRDEHGVHIAPVCTVPVGAADGGLAPLTVFQDPLFLGCIGPEEDGEVYESRCIEVMRAQ
jgi:hypothetical protein